MRSLFGKLLLSYLLILLIALGGVGLLLSNFFYNYYLGLKKEELGGRSRELAAAFAPFLQKAELRAQLQKQLELTRLAADAEICLLDKKDQVISRSRVPPGISKYSSKPGPLADLVRDLQPRMEKGEAIPCGEDMLVSAAEVTGASGKPLATLVLRARMAGISHTIGRVRQLILEAAILAILVSAFLALLLSSRLSGPLVAMRALAEKMAKGDYASRVAVSGKDEAGQLAQSLNSLASGLEQALGQLRAEQAKLRSVLTSMAEGVLAVAAGGQIVLANPQAAVLLGLREEELLGRQLALAALPTGLVEQIEHCLSARRMATIELETRDPGRTLAAQVVPLHSGPADTWGAVAVLRDISESRRLEEMRRRFVSDVSHELRTPLTSIAGFAAAIADGTAADDAARARCASVIRQEVGRMERLINDLLDLSRVESAAAAESEPVALRPLLESAVASLEPQAKERKISVHLDLPPSLPAVHADPDRLYQVILNLLSNAVRFNHEGGSVTVQARSERGLLRLSVRDTGPGIAQEDLPLIWERFHRADRSRERTVGGLGLGLAIVKAIVQAHGGTVGAESKPGEGSTFTVTFPIAS